MYEYEDSCNLFKCWGFFYNLKAVLINIFIVNLRLSSKFIAGDTVILRIHFQKKLNEKIKGNKFWEFLSVPILG